MKETLKNRIIKIWDEFDRIMNDLNYSTIIYDSLHEGKGTLTYNDSDKYMVSIDLRIWGDRADGRLATIFVYDRNGSILLNNNATRPVCIAQINDCGNSKDNFALLTKIINEIMSDYSCYNKDNRLDFVSKNIETKHLNYK